MPRMINGVGTRFYGQSNWRSDASFQTTEWLVLIYVPVVPFKSLRVRHNGGNSYRVFEELPLSLAQVSGTYAFALAYLLGMPATLIWAAGKMDFDASEAPMRTLAQLALLGVIAYAPFLALKLARRSALQRARAGRSRPGSQPR